MTLNLRLLGGFICCLFVVCISGGALAVELPAAADAARVDKDRQRMQRPALNEGIKMPDSMPKLSVPEKAKSVTFKLTRIKFEGVTALGDEELRNLYKDYLGKQVTLDVMWILANQVSDLYHQKGYFLSRAFVPEQEIENGVIRIKVVEGYIGKVEIQGDSGSNWVSNSIIDSITAEKPAKIETVESNLLLLDDLPGVTYRAVLEPMSQNGFDGAVKLTLIPQVKKAQFSVSYDNYGSRYLGPFEATATYTGSIIPMQKTSIIALSSTPSDELKYLSLTHEIPLPENFSIETYGSYTTAQPGYKLERSEVDSESINIGAALKYQYLRQRTENLSFKLAVEGKNSNTNLLEDPQTRDRIRVVRASLNYDKTDNWQGLNNMTLTLSHGLNILGSSDENDLYISRANSSPNFKKVELSLSRLQNLSQDWGVALSAAGQYSNETLYSSEQFGYGGQNFGRAYDSSEITGDSGVAGSAELRYYGIKLGDGMTTMPYLFYDIGKVWTITPDPTLDISGSSAGLGIRFNSDFGLGASLALAEPLTKQADAPQSSYSKNPRVLFQLSYGF